MSWQEFFYSLFDLFQAALARIRGIVTRVLQQEGTK